MSMSSQASNEAAAPVPAFLSYGFRPFFLLGSLFGVAMLALWVPWYLGIISLPSQFSPTVWHAHELLFGFVPAIIAGFLLTAVSNWTSRPPINGQRLAGLVAFWLIGRLAVSMSRDINELIVAGASLLFPLALTLALTREITAAGNKRNLKVAALVGSLAVTDAMFHYEAWLTGRAKLSIALAISLVLILLMVIAGRIIPSFTSNWLKANRPGPLPREFGLFDLVTNALSVVALGAWVASKMIDTAPVISTSIAILMIAAAAANLARQSRWQPLRTFHEPLVTILHIAYLFIPIGFALIGLAIPLDEPGLETAGLHAWTTGAFAIMMLAMMTRVSRGHTGNKLTAPLGTSVIYACIVLAALIRIAASLLPEKTLVLIPVAGLLWIAAFLGFALLYGHMLITPRRMK